MKTSIAAIALALLIVPFGAHPGEAGPLSNACLKSDRKAKSRRLCNCIQQVGDQSLSRADQKLAASFFRNPQKAQDIRQSDRRSHEIFWKRYKEFSQVVSASCAHLK